MQEDPENQEPVSGLGFDALNSMPNLEVCMYLCVCVYVYVCALGFDAHSSMPNLEVCMYLCVCVCIRMCIGV